MDLGFSELKPGEQDIDESIFPPSVPQKVKENFLKEHANEKMQKGKNRWLCQAGLVALTSPDWRLRRSGIITHARIIHDNGKQFTSRDFLDLVAKQELKETTTSPFHPQSNGKVGRMHRTFKTEEVRRSAYLGMVDAWEKMGRWVMFYNSERLHSAIGYLTPDDVFAGTMEERLAERRRKMYNATRMRQDYWKSQQA